MKSEEMLTCQQCKKKFSSVGEYWKHWVEARDNRKVDEEETKRIRKNIQDREQPLS